MWDKNISVDCVPSNIYVSDSDDDSTICSNGNHSYCSDAMSCIIIEVEIPASRNNRRRSGKLTISSSLGTLPRARNISQRATKLRWFLKKQRWKILWHLAAFFITLWPKIVGKWQLNRKIRRKRAIWLHQPKEAWFKKLQGDGNKSSNFTGNAWRTVMSTPNLRNP